MDEKTLACVLIMRGVVLYALVVTDVIEGERVVTEQSDRHLPVEQRVPTADDVPPPRPPSHSQMRM